MKSKNLIVFPACIICLLSLMFVLPGCSGSQDESATDDTSAEMQEESEPSDIVEIRARGLQLDAPDTIPSGWNTIRFVNPTGMTHFINAIKFPDGRGLKDHQEVLAPIFQNIMDNINGRELSAPEAGMELPEWTGGMKFYGGPGLLATGYTSETTINLDPGTYVFECYVKSEGIFHSYPASEGIVAMATEIIVTGEESSTTPPEPTMTLTISIDDGYVLEGDPTAGDQVIQVNNVDQKAYGNYQGHDVHLARLNDNTNMDSLLYWMNWSNPGGLNTPAPVEFIGGANEMAGGSTGYFTATLEPGQRYAFIAEIPKADSVNMLHVFTVPEGN